jgi:small-conductance mechanosensitive channel
VSFIPGFGEYSLDFSVGYSVASFVDQYQVQHELRRRILRRFRREGISIAIPARSLRVQAEAPAVSSNSKRGGSPGGEGSSG